MAEEADSRNRELEAGASGRTAPQTQQRWKRTEGFTLLELLTIVTIIGILASIAIVAYLKHVERARTVSAISDINTLVKAIRIYQIDHASLPASLADPEIEYGSLRDPWGNLYQYSQVPVRTRAGVPINTEFDVFSVGSDGMTALDIDAPVSRDDIIRADDDHYVGRADRY